jgi:hypothetical protein
MCHTLHLLAICFAPSLADLIIFLTLTRLVVVINFVNFSFTLFTPPLGDFQVPYWCSVLGVEDLQHNRLCSTHNVTLVEGAGPLLLSLWWSHLLGVSPVPCINEVGEVLGIGYD